MAEEESPADGGGAEAPRPDDSEDATRKAMQRLAVDDGAERAGPSGRRHAFWETQPVLQFRPELERIAAGGEEGAIDPPSGVEAVPKDPYKLPSAYQWCTCDMNDDAVAHEVYTLLTLNYVEDDDNMFRFDYSAPFLRWALQPPDYVPDWHVGVRATGSGKLVAFISGIPAKIRVQSRTVPMTEINFLCIHKKLRSKRLAPVLIKEITRRVHLRDVWQATYTAGVVLPKPVAVCRYWHRSLNPRKLIEVGFSRLQPRMTMSRTIKLYKLPDEPQTPGFREFELGDVQRVTGLINDHLQQYKLAPILSEEEIEHWLLPKPGVVNAFVVEDPESGVLTDFCSFYTLPSTVINHDQHDNLKAAYSYYNVANKTPLVQLMNDALIVAAKLKFDVFNALDLMHNSTFLKELKFGIGDGHLQYYLYNWKISQTLQPLEVGLVLL